MRVAQHLFRGSIGIKFGGPGETDLFLDDGKEIMVKAGIWTERVRSLNLLSLSIMLAFAAIALAVLRFLLRTKATSDFSSLFVKKAVGADPSRSPIEISRYENPTFPVFSSNSFRYRYGAETNDEDDVLSREY